MKYKLRGPSILLMNNIFFNWLQSSSSKKHKHLKVFLEKCMCENHRSHAPFGYLENKLVKYDDSTILKQNLKDYTPQSLSYISINLSVPESDSMQYFIQWQRHRKYWWSSISTTPSLFAINEVKHENDAVYADIIAQFPWVLYPVETVTMKSSKTDHRTYISCSTSLESAMITLLIDGMINSTNEGYLRLHRNMTPYKISFLILSKESSTKDKLCELAKLIYYKLKKQDISSFLPNFTLTVEQQIKENLQLGVAYTAVLSENTLVNGIFQILNSSTMLKEQVHVADFNIYAELICK